MGGPETRSATRCDGRSVFARVAKPVVEAGKRFFHRLTAAILTRSYQLSEVLKKALLYRGFVIRWLPVFQRSAECNSAIQQIENLRYVSTATLKRFSTMKYPG